MMAQVKRSIRQDLTTKNQENANIVGKNALLVRKVPTLTKRSVLGEIGNEISRGKGVVAGKKVISKPAPVKKEKEESVVDLHKNVSARQRLPLRRTQNSSSKATSEPVEDIDKDDKEDPFLVGDYVNDIYDYLRQVEAAYPIRENYLAGRELTGRMRAVLVDWLVDVHLQFHLLLETLYLSVSIIDRYLQDASSVPRKELQLVGVGAMYVACKYEEMFSPVVSDFVYICDNAFTCDQILKMEHLIVHKLNFSFSRPLPLHFLRRYSKAAHAIMKNHQMAKYILELALIEYDMCHYPPSQVSAAAMYLGLWPYKTPSVQLLKPGDPAERCRFCEWILQSVHSGDLDLQLQMSEMPAAYVARVFSQEKVWTKTLEHYTTYKYKDIELLVKKLANLILKTDKSRFKAVTKKYASSKFLKVSCMPELHSDALRRLAAGAS